jgi:hypothetical protein
MANIPPPVPGGFLASCMEARCTALRAAWVVGRPGPAGRPGVRVYTRRRPAARAAAAASCEERGGADLSAIGEIGQRNTEHGAPQVGTWNWNLGLGTLVFRSELLLITNCVSFKEGGQQLQGSASEPRAREEIRRKRRPTPPSPMARTLPVNGSTPTSGRPPPPSKFLVAVGFP